MQPVISIRNLEKSYGSKQVLKGINLDVYPGQILGCIGPNGAGKSTIVKILCGLLSDYEGEVKVKGHDLKKDAFYGRFIYTQPVAGSSKAIVHLLFWRLYQLPATVIFQAAKPGSKGRQFMRSIFLMLIPLLIGVLHYFIFTIMPLLILALLLASAALWLMAGSVH